MEPRRTAHGFEFGPMQVECACSDDKKGWALARIFSGKYPAGIQVYVTKTGKVRIFSNGSEWKPE